MKMKTLFHMLALTFISSFTFGQVDIKTNLPSSIAPNTNITIEIKINKGNITNFAKYQMDVPAGVNVTEGNSRTGNFSFESNRAKIVWVTIPTDPEFVVSFKMEIGSLSGSRVFNQKFFYLEDGTKKDVEADSINVNFDAAGATTAVSFPKTDNESDNSSTAATTITSVKSENTPSTTPSNTAAAANNSTTEAVATKTTAPRELTFAEKLDAHHEKHSTDKEVAKTPKKEIKKPKTTDVVKEVKQPDKTETNDKAETNSSSGLVFKVQLGAFGADPGKAKFKVAGKVNIISEGGLFKVLCGNFSTKEEAIKRKEELKEKGLDGFVVRYQDGVRVK
jgi:cell division septation protein DedD